MYAFILVTSAAVYKILTVLCDKACPGENDQFLIFFRLHHFIWSDYVGFAPDIDFAFFIVTQGICFDTNVLWFGMFGDFMDKIACIVLR